MLVISLEGMASKGLDLDFYGGSEGAVEYGTTELFEVGLVS